MNKYAIITEPNIEISDRSLKTAKKERPYDSLPELLISAHIMNGMRNGTTITEVECETIEEAREALKSFKCSYGRTSGFSGVEFFTVSFTYIEEYSYDECYEEWEEEGEYDFAEFRKEEG